MVKESKNDLVDEVSELLEQERQALLSGDLEAIGEMMDRKTELLEKLENAGEESLEQLTSLRETALRNQQLLDHALQGIKSVADRLAEMRKVRAQLDTYGADGNKMTFYTARHSVERRA
ncbi:flagellar biosynthesis protein FlgN [Roseobacteraceae bacterium S113]